MIYDNFEFDKVLYMCDDSEVILGKDNTCIKSAHTLKSITRLRNESQCLSMLQGNIGPKLIEYDEEYNAIRMEYIDGLNLEQYCNKYHSIPKSFFSKAVGNLFKLLEYGIEYGGDLKICEHFIIDEERQDVRLIDFGLSQIINEESASRWREYYKLEYAFLFSDSDQSSIKRSVNQMSEILGRKNINSEIIRQYFTDYDKIE